MHALKRPLRADGRAIIRNHARHRRMGTDAE
jgi:hypothetical protein